MSMKIRTFLTDTCCTTRSTKAVPTKHGEKNRSTALDSKTKENTFGSTKLPTKRKDRSSTETEHSTNFRKLPRFISIAACGPRLFRFPIEK